MPVVLGQLIALTLVLAQSSAESEYVIDPSVGAGSALIGALVGAWLGSTRGKTLLGAVLGLFCGCIGWIIILVAFKKPLRY